MVGLILWVVQWCSLGLAARVICGKLHGEDGFDSSDTFFMTLLGGFSWLAVAIFLAFRVVRIVDELNWKAVWELLTSDKDGREE